MNDQTTGYGKLVGGSLGLTVATAIVEVADQYLPHVLPNSVALAIAGVLTLASVWFTPHTISKGSAQ